MVTARKPKPKPKPKPVVIPKQTDAGAALQALFKSYGLGSLAPAILSYAKQGLTPDESMLKLQDTKEWKTRFAGNEIRRTKGLAVLSPAEYLSREAAYNEVMRSYGLPKGFYDQPSDYAKAIGSNLGSQELVQRLEARKAVVVDGANTGVFAYAKKKYGWTNGDLIAFFIDPNRAAPLLTKVAAASQIGAAAARTRWGDLAKSEAEKLVDLGVTADQAAAGFGQAAGLTELTANVTGRSGVKRQTLIDAVFKNDANAVRAVAREQEKRKAVFAAGGSFATGSEGVSGLGTANT